MQARGSGSGAYERGAAVVDFVLIMVLLIPIVLGVLHLGLVMHVRNTLTAAASEGARAAAVINGSPTLGAQRARELINAAVADRYATNVTVSYATVAGAPGTVVRIRAEVPALGAFGPTVSLSVDGHAVREELS